MGEQMLWLSDGEIVVVRPETPEEASTVGGFWSAVGQSMRTGRDHLAAFRGVTIDGFEAETDLDTIEWLARRGELDFAEIYLVDLEGEL